MPTHPASVHDDSPSSSHWVENEFKTPDLGDPRRDRRLKQIAADLHAQPGASLPRACGDWAGAKAARDRQPAEQKESRKWLQSARASAQAAAVLGGALVLSIGDREADSYELFLAHRQRRAQGGGPHELLMRCQHDRQLTHD